MSGRELSQVQVLARVTDWKNVYVRAATEAEQAAGRVPVTQFGPLPRDRVWDRAQRSVRAAGGGRD